MRIINKGGGVWKNSTDEVMKAAVMKYGKNQWDRISFLLADCKSGKQCKARWYSWLDPSIVKTEWTREEDEKLLHLAKLMPSQWRTIAPILGGRTPYQCLERYDKLLDSANKNEDKYEAGDDPRKLRPGEIDPNPESRPARPDPVDMDQDEIEMLSEARARLANTRGKKAKRKAREKQLQVARMLASLQKRRELKAAGIDASKRKRMRAGGIDYDVEIPFQKKPPPGFYDVSAEEDRLPMDQIKFPTTIQELEGEKRVDKEARLRKQDIARNSIAERQEDAPPPEAVGRRRSSKLNLPAPQISDHELEAISKIGMSNSNGELDEGSAASRVLLATYPQTPLTAPPMRTQTRVRKQDTIMMEAENQRSLTLSQTPLLGGENPILHPSDFSGVITPRPTPNPLLTPGTCSGLAPRIGSSTPKGTPMRDQLHINGDIMERLHIAKKKTPCFAKIPFPANEYKIAIPPIPEENEESEEKVEEDMSDRIARVNKKLDEEFTEAHQTCLEDFPGRKEYGLSSVASNIDKLSSLQSEFENVTKKLDEDTKKATRLEKKIKLLTAGYQKRAQDICLQMDTTTSETELECFKALQKQERLAASNRTTNLKEEVQKQNELEQTLQLKYGDLLVRKQRYQHLMEDFRVQADIAA